ncbi:MAG: hypothetical protein IK116_08700 [Firmicutes bacterium]|nr:hypothetical protein [Bacillota bacterium]
MTGFEQLPQLTTALGALAALVSLVTQLTKDLGWLARIPTDAQVIVTSLLLAACGVWLWAAAVGLPFSLTLAACALIWGLLSAFVAMYGWATFYDLAARFLPRDGGDADE